MAADAALPREVDHGAAAVQRAAQGPAQIDPPAARVGMKAPGRDGADRQLHGADQRLGLRDSSADMSSKSLCCRISLAEKVSVASSSTVGSSPSSGASPSPGSRRGPSASARRRAISCGAARRCRSGQQQLHRLLEQIGLAPEDVEGLVEQLALVAPVDEHRVQGPVEVGAAAEPDRLDRADRIEHLARADRHAGGAQARAKCMMLVANRPGSKRLREGAADEAASANRVPFA